MHLRTFIAHFCLLAWQLVAAEDVRVLGNDTRIRAGGGEWNYAADICPQAGFLAATNRGAYATLQFEGTGFSMYLLTVFNGALATVYLDNKPLARNVDLLESSSHAFQCSTRAINATSLVYKTHNVTVVHSGRSPNALAGQQDWLVLIEMTYTTDNVTSSSSATSPTSASSGISTTVSPAITSTSASSSTPVPSSSSGTGLVTDRGIGEGLIIGLLLGLGIAWC